MLSISFSVIQVSWFLGMSGCTWTEHIIEAAEPRLGTTNVARLTQEVVLDRSLLGTVWQFPTPRSHRGSIGGILFLKSWEMHRNYEEQSGRLFKVFWSRLALFI